MTFIRRSYKCPNRGQGICTTRGRSKRCRGKGAGQVQGHRGPACESPLLLQHGPGSKHNPHGHARHTTQPQCCVSVALKNDNRSPGARPIRSYLTGGWRQWWGGEGGGLRGPSLCRPAMGAALGMGGKGVGGRGQLQPLPARSYRAALCVAPLVPCVLPLVPCVVSLVAHPTWLHRV